MDVSLLLDWNFLANTVLAVLLAALIVFAVRLDRKLSLLRDGSGEMRQLITGLNQATERAQASIAQMSAAAKENEAGLSASIAKARDLSDELSLMTGSAESLAERLSGSVGSSRVEAEKPKPRFATVSDVAPKGQEAEFAADVSSAEASGLRQLLSGIR